jgi:hypothetical protein
MTNVSTAIICPVTQIVNRRLSSKVHALKGDIFWRYKRYMNMPEWIECGAKTKLLYAERLSGKHSNNDGFLVFAEDRTHGVGNLPNRA